LPLAEPVGPSVPTVISKTGILCLPSHMAPAQLAGVTSCFVCEFAATSKLMQALHPQKHHDQYPGTHQTSGSVQACTSAVHVSTSSTTKRRDDTISTDETVASQDVYWASEAVCAADICESSSVVSAAGVDTSLLRRR